MAVGYFRVAGTGAAVMRVSRWSEWVCLSAGRLLVRRRQKFDAVHQDAPEASQLPSRDLAG